MKKKEERRKKEEFGQFSEYYIHLSSNAFGNDSHGGDGGALILKEGIDFF